MGFTSLVLPSSIKKKNIQKFIILFYIFIHTHISQREITFNTTGVISVIL